MSFSIFDIPLKNNLPIPHIPSKKSFLSYCYHTHTNAHLSILIRHKTHFQRFDLEREHTGEIAAERKIAAEEPEAGMVGAAALFFFLGLALKVSVWGF